MIESIIRGAIAETCVIVASLLSIILYTPFLFIDDRCLIATITDNIFYVSIFYYVVIIILQMLNKRLSKAAMDIIVFFGIIIVLPLLIFEILTYIHVIVCFFANVLSNSKGIEEIINKMY